MREEREKIMNHGFDGYIVKPIKLDVMVDEIKKCLPHLVIATVKDDKNLWYGVNFIHGGLIAEYCKLYFEILTQVAYATFGLQLNSIYSS